MKPKRSRLLPSGDDSPDKEEARCWAVFAAATIIILLTIKFLHS